MKALCNKYLSMLAVTSCLLLSNLGCMAAPGNLKEIANRSTAIEFSGFTVHPSQTVNLYVLNANSTWTKIGQVDSSDKAYEHFGTDWYFWHKSIVVPKQYWKQFGDTGGYFIVVKGMADGNDLFSFKEGFYNYYEDYDSLQELYEENKSPDGVKVVVWTANP